MSRKTSSAIRSEQIDKDKLAVRSGEKNRVPFFQTIMPLDNKNATRFFMFH